MFQIMIDHLFRVRIRVFIIERRLTRHFVQTADFPHIAVPMGFHRASGVTNERRRRRVRLKATFSPATALFAVHHDDGMSELRTGGFIPFEEHSFRNNSRAYARAERDHDHVFTTLRRAEFRLAKRRHVGVVGNFYLHAAHQRGYFFGDMEILPLQVSCENDVARLAVDHAGNAHTEPHHVVFGQVHRVHQRVRKHGNIHRHSLAALFRFRRYFIRIDDFPRFVHDAALDERTAQIDAYVILLFLFHSPFPTPSSFISTHTWYALLQFFAYKSNAKAVTSSE